MSKKLHNRASALPTLLWLMLLALLPAQLSARDFQYTYEGRTLTYTVIDEYKKTVKTREGTEFSPGNNVFSGDLIVPSKVFYYSEEYTVVGIGDFSFMTQSGMRSVTIPGSVTYIGGNAFYGCNGLASVSIPASVNSIGRSAFESCSLMRSFRIEDG